MKLNLSIILKFKKRSYLINILKNTIMLNKIDWYYYKCKFFIVNYIFIIIIYNDIIDNINL